MGPAQPHEKGIHTRPFGRGGDVAYFVVVWFSDESYYGQGIARGVWAGDRFDIRAVATVELEGDNELDEP